MYWDLTWKYPLLINENGVVIAKDNGNGDVISIEDNLTKDEFIKEATEFWNTLIEEIDDTAEN